MFSIAGSYKQYYSVLTADKTLSAGKVNELGVEGTVDRQDIGITFGGSVFESCMPHFKNIAFTPFIYVGYSDGKTVLNYIDGLEISFREAGVNFGGGINIFDKSNSITYSASWGYAFLNNSELQFSDKITTRKATGDTTGYSIDLSISYYIARDFDLVAGLKTNHYTIHFETGSFKGEAEDELNQIYGGLRYYF